MDMIVIYNRYNIKSEIPKKHVQQPLSPLNRECMGTVVSKFPPYLHRRPFDKMEYPENRTKKGIKPLLRFLWKSKKVTPGGITCHLVFQLENPMNQLY
jgi:hypothetical protein